MQKAIELVCNGLTLRGMLHLPETGKGKYPFVAIYHGFTGNKAECHFMFVRLSRELEKAGVGSIRFDFSGSGESDGLFEEMTATREIEEAKEIFKYMEKLEFVDTSRLFLLGMSMGGFVASAAAPEVEGVKGLVLWAPAGSMAGYTEKRMTENRDFIDDSGRIDIGGLFMGPGLHQDIRSIDIYRLAAGFKGRVHIVHGTQDEAIPIEASYKYLKTYEGRAKLIEIEGSDHGFSRMKWQDILISSTIDFIKGLC